MNDKEINLRIEHRHLRLMLIDLKSLTRHYGQIENDFDDWQHPFSSAVKTFTDKLNQRLTAIERELQPE